LIAGYHHKRFYFFFVVFEVVSPQVADVPKNGKQIAHHVDRVIHELEIKILLGILSHGIFILIDVVCFCHLVPSIVDSPYLLIKIA